MLFLVRLETIVGWPDIRATYRYDEDSVIVHGVGVAEEDENES